MKINELFLLISPIALIVSFVIGYFLATKSLNKSH
jgi:uncharacterized protein YneF (UPF0154 family)